MGGGERTSAHSPSKERMSLLDHTFSVNEDCGLKFNDLVDCASSASFDPQILHSLSEGYGLKFEEFSDLDACASSASFDSEILRRSKRRVYEELVQSYNSLQMRIGSLEDAKNKILSYKPGAWIEEVGGMRMTDYDIPNTTTLILIGPKGSGKSSLVNRISRVFGDDKFTSERAQVSYNSSIVGGTHFLQEYMIPRDSTSFCLYDTPSLSENSANNLEIIKSWLTDGVHHGEMVIRDSDKCKAQQTDYYSREMRMVNFVIFVVNGLSVLKSMKDGDSMQYSHMLVETFSCPYLSFKDDKPVVVITHGDLLSFSDRARVRVHLGELLGIPPTKQIFDISEKSDPETDLTVLDMLQYSLEHADRNLAAKCWSLGKVLRALAMMVLACVFLFSFLGISHSINWHAIHRYLCNSKNLNWLALKHLGCRSSIDINWQAIRHLWLG